VAIAANAAVTLTNSDITTSAAQSSGGAINITAGDVRLYGDSDITTSVFSGTGGGGDIKLAADSIVALGDSDILAFARDGQGGNVTLNTPAFFGQNYQPAPPGTDPNMLDENDRVDINASGAVAGIITLPDTSFVQNSLRELPTNLIDTSNLIANSCIARSTQQGGSFIVTGLGGLPSRPGDASGSTYPTGTVKSVLKEGEAVRSPTSSSPRSWRIGDAIIEPQGVYRLPDGRLIMSRQCS
jgi:large exoprotein involved in heme utilization and adhesion